MDTPRFAHCLFVAAAWVAVPGWVRAEVLHSGAGLPSSMVFHPKPLSSNSPLRTETEPLPETGRATLDEATFSTHHAKVYHGSWLSGWYTAAQMRLRGGMPLERPPIDLRAGMEPHRPVFGEVPHAAAQNERIDGALRASNAQPYLGAAFMQSSASGVELDIGGAFARASLNDRPGGPSLGAVSQTALDHELAQLRDGIGRARLLPPVTLGMRLRF